MCALIVCMCGDAGATVRIQSLTADRVWVRPGETASVAVAFQFFDSSPSDPSLSVRLKRFDGEIVFSQQMANLPETAHVPVPTPDLREGGYLIEATLEENGAVTDAAREVLTVARNISDDLRYGFYANWDKPGADYDRKAGLFARLHINAIEYYDYFPAHGRYAPTAAVYTYEPFGIRILGDDVRRKIESARRRGILSIAYVAAYAASRSVYERYPYPMTDAAGTPRIFNGSVMTESEAKRRGKPVWFHLMAIDRDSKWRAYIMDEFRRALDDSPADIFSFDGFEIDSYGHDRNDRYYSRGSRHSGRLLSDVIMELVTDVRVMTHGMKDPAAVSFNCVDEYGIESMYGAVDFLFIENWASHKSRLEDLVDICFRHRRPNNQRVILKVYPADMKPARKSWPAENLRYVLAAALTGGGSVMVAGEPAERRGEMHALNSLYYPDNVAMSNENFDILRNYNFLDALLYRITHGSNVRNLETDVRLPGCVVRSFDSDEGWMAVQILRTGGNRDWCRPIAPPDPLTDTELVVPMPAGKRPLHIYYASPDSDEFLIPRPVDWTLSAGRVSASGAPSAGQVHARIPNLTVFGVVLIRYE